jgi:hypothetical protein
MITILASLLGFLGSTLPNIFKLFQDNQDKAQELAIMNLQIEYAKLNLATQLQEVQVSAAGEELKTLYSTYETGIKWVDALNGCVRPIIAFSFFFLFFIAKLPCIFLAFHDISLGQAFSEAVMYGLWGDNDSAIFAGIIAFYFGSRSMSKIK